MKKIKDFKINSENILKDDDLLKIIGSEDLYYCQWYSAFGGPFYGFGYGSNCHEAESRLCTQQLDVIYGFCSCSSNEFWCFDY